MIINKNFLTMASLILAFLLFFNFVRAEEGRKVDYGDGVIVDSDLDGLTDEGEKQIFKTDPNNPDTDGDGIFDGTEIIGGTDALNSTTPATKEVVTERVVEEGETPWAWYITRSSALVGFFLLYISFLFGLIICAPFLKRFISPADSFSVHCWISVQSLVFALIHGVSLTFDKFINFSWAEAFVPFAFKADGSALTMKYANELVAFGTISLYLIIALIITSYLRRFIGQKAWRSIHYLNIGLYILSFTHALFLGTDLKSGIGREIFIVANIILGILIIIRILFKIISKFKKNEDICESFPAVESK